MGRLAGFSAADAIRRLRRAGFIFDPLFPNLR